MPSAPQHVQIYRIKNQFVIVAMDQTSAGLWTVGANPHACPADAPAEQVGALVVRALGEGLNPRPPVVDWKALVAPLLAACGVRSWSALQKQARHVTVVNDGERITVTPSRNGGSTSEDRGFHALDDAALTLDAPATPAQLGAALADAFARCT